jgi:hypothetical protein
MVYRAAPPSGHLVATRKTRGGRTRRALKLTAIIIVGVGCQPRPQLLQPERCAPGVPSDAQHPLVSRISLLAGEYDLIQVRTQPDAGSFSSGLLHLEPLDSAAREGAVGGAARDLVGWLDRRETREADNRPRIDVVLRGDHLIVGSPGDLDQSVEHLTITAVARQGFWGWWKAETGMQVTAHGGERVLPDPAGYFCALRVLP